ncbi:MAG: hypothetical protein IPG04_16255 [Polyangiaceae bacterium]|nr:hypothetical protein [Polyangiaceae bacterium]
MSDELDQDKYVDEAVPMKKLPAGDPRGPTAVSPRAQATVPQDPLPFEDDKAAEPEPGGEPASSRLTRPVKIGLIVGASILALIASALVYVTVRFDAILRDSIRAQAKERGLDMKFEGVESTGILPWQSGEPRVTLSGVTLTSEEAPHVEISLERVVVPLKGGFPSYEPDLVEVTGGSLTAPDLPSIIALERSARSGKASKTTAVLRDTEVRIARISEKAPFTVIGRASRIDVGDGRVDLEGVTLEVPVPFGDFTVGPIGAEIERTADFTWARFDSMKSARFGGERRRDAREAPGRPGRQPRDRQGARARSAADEDLRHRRRAAQRLRGAQRHVRHPARWLRPAAPEGAQRHLAREEDAAHRQDEGGG